MKIYEITPIGKPRMTQRDRWHKRPATAAYWAYKEQVRLLGIRLPESGYHVTFVIRNKYRTGDGCDYAGTRYFDKNNNPVSDPSLDECNGTLTACKLRHGDGNELPFGGFPGTSLIRS